MLSPSPIRLSRMTDPLLDITGIGRRGDGLAMHDGRQVFLPYTLPGETITATISGERAAISHIEKASPARVQPFCPYFGTCGGCQLQHWDTIPYQAWKRGLVEATLHHRGIAVPVSDLIDAHGFGRRRVSLHVHRKDGIVTAGFMAVRSHVLQAIDHCPILVPALHNATTIARRLGDKLGDCGVVLTATNGGIDAAVKAERKIVEREAAKFAALGLDLDLARLSVNGETIVTRNPPTVKMGRADVVLPAVSFLQATEEG